MVDYSTNERAEQVMGQRLSHGDGPVIAIDAPCELGFHCPVCDYGHGNGSHDEPWDERLEWSEYNSFIWCSVCNRDYPSALCMPDIEKAIDIFLSSVEDAIASKA